MPANGITIKNLNGFRQTFREYMKFSKRDIRTALDTKAFYIMRGAVRNTMSPSKEKILSELADTDTSKKYPGAPLGAIIINSRRGRQGLKGLYGRAMDSALMSLIKSRWRSRRFIAAGWLPGIRKMDAYAENKGRAPRRDSSVKQFGRDKGGATPASTLTESAVARAVIFNAANTNRDVKGALDTYGMPGFVQSWNDEIDSMKQYMLDKLQKRANAISTRTH